MISDFGIFVIFAFVFLFLSVFPPRVFVFPFSDS